MFAPPRPILAAGRVRHVGDPVAFVIATGRALAQEAADAVRVSYRELPAVANAEAALAPNAPPVWAELPDNTAFRWETGDEEGSAALIAAAMHVTKLRVVNNRLVASPIEPRSATAEYDSRRAAWTLHTATQGAWLVRNLIASAALGVPADRLRVITPDVGGSFGSKIFPYPEHVLVCHAAQKLRRPVRWTADRSEAFLVRDERSLSSSLPETSSTADTAIATFTNGCHVAEVEVDPETGVVDLLRYIAADDIGRVVDERLAEGQIHGGIAQGYGQAVRELACYDPNGQLLAGSFMDYAMPRAADLPSLDVGFVEIPATTNPLGTKGAGEAGAIASAPAIVSAVLDALAPEGVEHIEMPLMPARVWEALNRAKKSLVVETTASPD